MRIIKKTCGTCAHKLNAEKGEHVCGNRESDRCTDYVLYDEYCEEWEERDGR